MAKRVALLALGAAALCGRLAQAIPPPWTIEELKGGADAVAIVKTGKIEPVENVRGANARIGIVALKVLKGEIAAKAQKGWKDAKLHLLYTKPIERVGPGGIRMHVIGGVGHPKPQEGETALVFLRKGREEGSFQALGGSFGYIKLAFATKEQRAATRKRIERYRQWCVRIKDEALRQAMDGYYKSTLEFVEKAGAKGSVVPEPRAQ